MALTPRKAALAAGYAPADRGLAAEWLRRPRCSRQFLQRYGIHWPLLLGWVNHPGRTVRYGAGYTDDEGFAVYYWIPTPESLPPRYARQQAKDLAERRVRDMGFAKWGQARTKER